MQMTLGQSDSEAATAVVVLTGRGILELDVGEALAQAGWSMVDAFPQRALAPALIVDTEALDRRTTAMVRRHAKAGVPVLIITDDETAARRIDGRKTEFFTKPLVSDVVVAALNRLAAKG